MKRTLLLGCGNSRERRMGIIGESDRTWGELTTLDNDTACKPDVCFDLWAGWAPLPFPDNTFDEIHAYEVLEHIGAQGDARAFFRQFSDYWRVMKPGTFFFASVPWWQSQWAFADPGHRRVIAPGTLAFLDQAEYVKQIGKTTMCDYRNLWKGDFSIIGSEQQDEMFVFILRAHKPPRH